MVLKCVWLMIWVDFSLKAKLKAVFSNGPRSQPKNLLNCTILDSWVLDNFILVDNLFAKALRRLETCVSVVETYVETLLCFLVNLDFKQNYFVVLPSDQHQVLLVQLNLLLSSCYYFLNKHNPVDNRLFNHLLDLSQFFECYHLF